MSRASEMTQADVEAIEALLNHRLGGRGRGLRVESQPQGLILTGCPSSYHAKQLAQYMILEELGLSVLANQIAVHPAHALDGRCPTPCPNRPADDRTARRVVSVPATPIEWLDRLPHRHCGRALNRGPQIGTMRCPYYESLFRNNPSGNAAPAPRWESRCVINCPAVSP